MPLHTCILSAVALSAATAFGTASAARADTLPGMKGMDHIGITVPDLVQATSFLTDVLGCSKPAFVVGPFKSEDDWMQVHLNVDPRAEIPQLATVRCGYGSNVEVFQYKAEGASRTEPRNSDIGGHHLAFYVEDMAAAVSYLKSKGVRMQGDPTTFTQGPIAGVTFEYFLAPWGMQMELVSAPAGAAYEKDGSQKLWTPKDPGH
jgi:catechol 2,3-dioxygenase-like lactoylglutathione lyase family enzyme